MVVEQLLRRNTPNRRHRSTRCRAIYPNAGFQSGESGIILTRQACRNLFNIPQPFRPGRCLDHCEAPNARINVSLALTLSSGRCVRRRRLLQCWRQ